ncbi:MAG: NnrS family protein [Betaproteobacteria bacterium]
MAPPIDLNAPAGEPVVREPFALWQLGLRPFYLLASAFASLSIGLWAAQYAGWLTTPYLDGPMWHAHEMIFGFALAVIAGFLLTAVRNWTGQPTPSGGMLMALVALWIAGRVLLLTPFRVTAAAIDTLFPIAVALGIGVPLVRSGNRRNYLFIGLLLAMALLDLTEHLARLRVIALTERYAVQGALDVVLLIMTVMGGRVIPMFTSNGVRGSQPRRNTAIERLAPASAVALLVADLLTLPAWALIGVLVLGAIVQAVRVWLWRPWQTLRAPLVWVLHAGYLWIPVYLGLRALAEAGELPTPIATHALTAGAIGMLTIGMMTRTARGHSGRPLTADRYEVAAYMLVGIAAITRVLLPLVAMSAYRGAVIASAFMWSLAWAIYVARYWPILTRPRVDGKPG